MCTVTLSYDGNNALAQEKLAALMQTGLFFEIPVTGAEEDFPDLDYSDPDIWKVGDELSPLPEGKDSYTLEEFREILVNDLRKVYGMKDEVYV